MGWALAAARGGLEMLVAILRRSYVFALSLFVASVGLLVSLDLFPEDILMMAAVANDKGLFREVVLVVVPVVAISLLSAFDLYLFRRGLADSPKGFRAAVAAIFTLAFGELIFLIAKFASLQQSLAPPQFERAWMHLQSLVVLALALEILLAFARPPHIIEGAGAAPAATEANA